MTFVNIFIDTSFFLNPMKKMRFFFKIKLISFFETHDFCNTIPLIFNAKIVLALTLVVMVIYFHNI